MNAPLRSGVRLVGLLIALTGWSGAAEAQLVNREDPCFILLLEGSPGAEVLTGGSWNDRDDVAAAASVLRGRATWFKAAVTGAKAQMGTAEWSPVALERLRGLNRCLPWLRRLLGTLEGHLKRLDITSILVTTTRQQLASDALLRVIRAELDDAERMLEEMLRP